MRGAALGALLLGVPLSIPHSLSAQEPRRPAVLLVTAHPDDDAAFAGAVYQITHQLRGAVDVALVTDGSGGFRFATLAEPIYGLKLTDESVARQYLPAIRKRELMAGGAIVGIRNYFFLDQLDHQFTTSADTVLRAVWDSAFVRQRLAGIMERGAYDVVMGLLPYQTTHGHHQAATLLALRAARSLPEGRRPLVLAGFPCNLDGTDRRFEGLPGYADTRVSGGEALVRFDRTQKVGLDGRLDFRIIGNWVIAEHKSQGTMQLLMNLGEVECYWYFDANGPEGREGVVRLFEALKVR